VQSAAELPWNMSATYLKIINFKMFGFSFSKIHREIISINRPTRRLKWAKK